MGWCVLLDLFRRPGRRTIDALETGRVRVGSRAAACRGDANRMYPRPHTDAQALHYGPLPLLSLDARCSPAPIAHAYAHAEAAEAARAARHARALPNLALLYIEDATRANGIVDRQRGSSGHEQLQVHICFCSALQFARWRHRASAQRNTPRAYCRRYHCTGEHDNCSTHRMAAQMSDFKTTDPSNQ